MKRAKKPAKAQRTYQARLTDPDGSLDGVLGAYADLCGVPSSGWSSMMMNNFGN